MCTCDKDTQSRLIPNKIDPCELHFVFEVLAKTEHWKRIRKLEISCGKRPTGSFHEGKHDLALESCQFFTLSPPQLTILEWDNSHIRNSDPLQPFTNYGPWHGQFMRLNHLTSFDLVHTRISTECIKTFMLNNPGLETLFLDENWFEGGSKTPPVDLPNLKSLVVWFPHSDLAPRFHAPAFQRLSSLTISIDDDSPWAFHATGHETTLTFNHAFKEIVYGWEDVTGFTRPTIQHVPLENRDGIEVGPEEENRGGLPLFMDAHTLEIGRGYANFYCGFLSDLKHLGPQLKTIRFEIPGGSEPYLPLGYKYKWWTDKLLDFIEDLVIYRFEHGRPFFPVERMVVSKSKRVNREQDLVWQFFYNDRHLDRYLLHE
ncbi:hypothetical protein BJ322DRAFT_729341 [Thelephora terrestris]|uniref:Uncharacterized protein n=1 Tax=Thelephora terrestris TaxID=56493 RepID=A0A9P6HIR6_9AGAM|nr:hypothetical protein BJ322DRAFT_729341 [Thelephora terrestris]